MERTEPIARSAPGPTPRALTYLLPRVSDVLFGAIFAAVLMLGSRLLGDGDPGRHLTLGEYMLSNHRIPSVDVFSHTMSGQPLTPHEWLSEILFALSYRVGGMHGVVLLSALLLALTVTEVFRQGCRRSGLILAPMLLAAWAATAANVHWLARPHLWTMLMIVLWSGHLERLRRGESRRWWPLPLLMLLWANLHGAFIAGFVVWITYGVGYAWNRLSTPSDEEYPRGWLSRWAGAGGASLAASLANPAGWHLWETSIGYLRNRYLVDGTVEYWSPNFHLTSTWPFLALLACYLFALGMRWVRLRPTSVLLVTSWAAMSLYSSRNIPLWSLMTAPILAEGLSRAWPGRDSSAAAWMRIDNRVAAIDNGLRGHVWGASIVVLLAVLLAGGARIDRDQRGNDFDSREFPVEAVNWMTRNPVAGNGFNFFPWGGYLLFRLWPEQKVFIDGQTDFYGEPLTREYEKVIGVNEGWEAILERYQVRWALVPTRSLLARTLARTGVWSTAYEDATAALLVRH